MCNIRAIRCQIHSRVERVESAKSALGTREGPSTMATAHDAFRHLDDAIFQPARTASANGRDRQTLREAKEAVERTRARYQQMQSVEQIRAAFVSDLNSASGRVLAAKLEWLGLPRFEDIRDEFLALCER